MTNLKTIGFLILIVLCGLIPKILSGQKKYKESLDIFYAQSEDAQSIYTGKVRDVFDPLDEAYQISASLKHLLDIERPSFHEDSSIWPIISLWVDPKDFNSEDRGIITHGQKKGRLWERATFVDYFENNSNVFNTYAGLRQHGGTSRLKSQTLKSFRLYFKKKYGASEFISTKKLSLSPEGKIKRLVIKRDIYLHFGNSFSFFFINALGGLAPKVELVKLYINGKFYAYQMMTEHLSREQLKFFWGHEDFLFAKIKGDQDIHSRILYKDLRSKLESSRNINFDYVNKKIDMDSVMASLLVIMYTGMTDWAQGVYTKDIKINSKWKLISWDFDRAFYPVKGESVRVGMKNDYEMKSVALGMDMKKGQIRWSIFNRLIHKDKKFRSYFSGLVDNLFEKVLKGRTYNEFLVKADKLAKTSNDPKMNNDLKRIKDFIKFRKKTLCDDLKARVNLVPQTCQKDLLSN